MKKLLILFMAIALTSCNKNGETNSASGARVEITPCIVTKVVLKDTLEVNKIFAKDADLKIVFGEPGISYDNNPALYLEKKEFESLQSSLWALLQNPKSKVFLGLNGAAPDWNKPANKSDLRNRMIVCDSVQEVKYDDKGQEIVTAKFACDSTTVIEGVSCIYFYESWYFNKETNMIEKEVLGYSVFQYVEEKQAFRQLFFVFRDEEALKKVKENYTEL